MENFTIKKKQSHGFKRFFVAVVSILILGGIAYLVWPFLSFSPQPIKIDEVVSKVSDNKQSEDELATPRLVLPSTGVSAYIQDVGVVEDGNMGVPDNMQDVAWYKDGVALGGQGNAVVAGHVSSWRGPAVFAKLHELKYGDEVYVITKDEQVLKYKVVDKQEYKVEDAPLEQIFGQTDQKRLNLITCSGGWNWREQTFNNRLVVYTEFVQQDSA